MLFRTANSSQLNLNCLMVWLFLDGVCTVDIIVPHLCWISNPQTCDFQSPVLLVAVSLTYRHRSKDNNKTMYLT